MTADELMKEMERIHKAFQAQDQCAEYEIQRILNKSRAMLDKPEWEALDRFLHDPKLLKWEQVEGPKDVKFFLQEPFEPSEGQLQYFRDLIAVCHTGSEWEMPHTGHKYVIDKEKKFFKLIHMPQHDPDDYHNKNRVCLDRLGWKLIDSVATSRTFLGKADGWRFTIGDFAIDDQKNEETGQYYPPGTRGQELICAAPSGKSLRLGHIIGRIMIKAAVPDFGSAKSTAAAEKLKK